MISHPINRVQAIKSKFENLNSESVPIKQHSQLYKLRNECERKENKEKSREIKHEQKASEIETDSSDEYTPKPNSSALYKIDVKRSVSDSKAPLSRQISDPGKKLHRSHAFRCDRNQKLNSPKRHGSCNGRSETSEFLKMERKLSKDRLKRLGNVLEQQMKKENFVPFKLDNDEAIAGVVKEVSPHNSIPDENVPPHILAQYAQVIKPKKCDDKQEAMTDSGVSSETENLDDDKSGRVKKIMSQFESIEKTDPENVESTSVVPIPIDLKTNLDVMEDLACSSETMKLERKNPHLKLTDTLKKALKQPLPPGPPPKKPPRTFGPPEVVEKEKSDTKRKLEKLEQVLMKHEAKKDHNIYDIAEENLSLKKPKEVHYLCTEILDITQRTLLPNQNDSPLKSCLNKLNCVATNQSMSSLPYTRLSSGFDSNCNTLKSGCSCSQNSLNKDISPLRTFMSEKCSKCQLNDDKDNSFKCHLNCKCRTEKSEFFLNEHIYDEPYVSKNELKSDKCGRYGTLNSVKVNSAISKSMEELSGKDMKTDTAIYEIPSDFRPSTPDTTTKTEFQRLRENFENRSNQTNSSNPTNSSNQTNSPNQPIQPEVNKPVSLIKMAKSTENVFEDGKFKKKSPERKFATEVKRYKPRESFGFSLPKKNPQLDVDRENLNRLMNEIYETVTAACIMEENKPGSFPTDQSDGSTSEESVKLTRSLTEKRKNYVRRVSSRLAYLEPKNIRQTRYRHQTSICSYKSEIVDHPYSTFRSWKSFRTSQNNLAKDKMETDSKYNLTDSSGNILSMKGEFDSDVSIDNLSIDEKTGCVDIELPFEPRENGLFNVCLLVGLNYMTGEAYVKSVFPSQVQVPQHIENLIFPETLSQEKGEWSADAKSSQCYSFVLTDERGERSYGYCRRVLPEGATTCLPLCYCVIGKYRAPGFYYKVLQELESHHGSSDDEIQSILQQLFELDFPNPGEEITITSSKRDFKHHNSSNSDLTLKDIKESLLNDLSKHIKDDRKNSLNNSESSKKDDLTESINDSTRSVNDSARSVNDSARSVNDSARSVNDSARIFNDSARIVNDSARSVNDSSKNFKDLKSQFSVIDVPSSKNITDNSKCKTMPVLRRSDGDGEYDLSADYYDYENNNGPMKVLLDLGSPKTKSIKQPLDPRAEEVSASQLLDSLGAGLLIKVFGSLLLERKVIIRADRLSVVSSRLEALQASLYPFVWQQPLISLVPAEIQQELLHAPLPMLAGMLGSGGEVDLGGVAFEEGMLIDLSHPSKVLFYQGDESTILPTTSYKTLKTSLQMESTKNKDKGDTKTRNVMISETFLRFFVDILGDFWRFFHFGVLGDGDLGRGNVVFDKDSFIKNAASKQNQYFLEWFTETAMFNHFIQNMSVRYRETYFRDSPKTPDSKSKDSVRPPDSIRPPDSVRPQDAKSDPDLLDSQYKLIDCPTPNFYQLFEERVLSRRNSKVVDRSGYKNALNKRVRLLKSRLKDLVG